MNWDSSKIGLGDLRIREALLPYEEFEYAITTSIALPAPSTPLPAQQDFLRTRRTCREFGPISVVDLAPFLWQAAHTCDRVAGAYGTVELRPAPSAGARHPIDILIVDARRAQAYVYRPPLHSLDEIRMEPTDLRELADAARTVLDVGDGLLVWLVAQPARTLAKYEHGEAFVLIDAGALMATLSFAAHATGLAYSALGLSGEPWISRLLHSQGKAVGMLGGVVGTRRA
jgi:SagB-type dehydrogenase family enzyme